MPSHVRAGLGVAGSLLCLHAVAATSTFDSDAEGWRLGDFYGDYGTPYSPPTAVTYHGSGGNPGGYISGFDPSLNSFFFMAPPKFLGNQSKAYGTIFTFDLKVDLTADWEEDVDLVLVGSGLTLTREFGISPDGTWRGFGVPLTEAGWKIGGPSGAPPSQAEFQSVLGSLTGLHIIGELVTGVIETTSIDNVSLVPEPGLWATVAAGGLGMFAAWRRRRTVPT